MKKSTKNILIAFILNFSFTIIEIVGGIMTNSVAILSDAVHDFGDSLSIGMAYFFEKKSGKTADKNYTYGYARYSIISAFITNLILLIGSIFVIYSAITRFISPQEVDAKGMFILSILGIIINGFAVLKTIKGEKLNEKSINLHLLEDVLGWVIVFIGSIVMWVFNISIIDSILTILVTIFILINVYKNFKSVFAIFLEKTPKDFNVDNFVEEMKEHIAGIIDIHHIHVWLLDDVSIICTMHVVVKNELSKEEISHLKSELKEEAKEHFNISHLTAEIEYESEMCEAKTCDVSMQVHSCAHHHHGHAH